MDTIPQPLPTVEGHVAEANPQDMQHPNPSPSPSPRERKRIKRPLENEIRRYEWIVRVLKGREPVSLEMDYLKEIYFWKILKRHRFFTRRDDFICEHALNTHVKDKGTVCSYCPARILDPDFLCIDPEYHHSEKPVEYLKKLKELKDEVYGK